MKYSVEQVERCARLYKTNADAGRALGIAGASFLRLCRRFKVVPPHQRRQDAGNHRP